MFTDGDELFMFDTFSSSKVLLSVPANMTIIFGSVNYIPIIMLIPFRTHHTFNITPASRLFLFDSM